MTVAAAEELCYLSIHRLRELYRAGSLSPVDVLNAVLDRTDRLNGQINAWISMRREAAIEEARSAEAAFHRGDDLGALAGIPVAVKDCFDVAGLPTTFGSIVPTETPEERDGTAVAGLRSAGAILVGKTNMMEFGMGVEAHPNFGPTWNPWRLDRVSGGSSGGSAAAVAAGLIHGALGSDTGGSIRAPACYCGVVGMKPSYGRVSRRGAGDLAWTLDHAGPIGRSVDDVAILLEAISGPDVQDPTTWIDSPVPRASALAARGMTNLRVGVVRDYPVTPVTAAVAEAFAHSLDIVEADGATIVELAIPALRYANEALWVIMVAEAAAVHEERLRTRRSAYTAATLRLLTIGEHCSATDYLYALRYRARLVEEFASAFDSVDVIMWPTKAETAGPRRPPGDQTGAKLNLELRAPYNLTGMPAITVPVALDPDGLPIGMQFAGPLYEDLRVLQVAKSFTEISGWKPQIPRGLVGSPVPAT